MLFISHGHSSQKPRVFKNDKDYDSTYDSTSSTYGHQKPSRSVFPLPPGRKPGPGSGRLPNFNFNGLQHLKAELIARLLDSSIEDLDEDLPSMLPAPPPSTSFPTPGQRVAKSFQRELSKCINPTRIASQANAVEAFENGQPQSMLLIPHDTATVPSISKHLPKHGEIKLSSSLSKLWNLYTKTSRTHVLQVLSGGLRFHPAELSQLAGLGRVRKKWKNSTHLHTPLESENSNLSVLAKLHSARNLAGACPFPPTRTNTNI